MAIVKTAQPGDPPWLKLAFNEVGILEGAGKKNNPRVVAYYEAAGHPEVKVDAVPWCAAFVGAMLFEAGEPTTNSLAARSYLEWGKSASKPRRGDIVVFKRGTGWQGHVAFYLGEERGRIYHLGGNQSDRVSITSSPKSTLLGIRTPVRLNPITGNSTTMKAQMLAGAGTAGTATATAYQQAEESGWLGEGLGQTMLDIGTQLVSTVTGWIAMAGVALIAFAIFWTMRERKLKWEDKGV